MSLASQSRVREEEDFEEAYLALDCVKLWESIRRTHLTHIYGVEDPMKEMNILKQETRFAALKQGEREYISTFKQRSTTRCTGTDNLGGILNFFVSHIYLTSFGVLVNHDLDK
jgi:hypothetical protein